MWKLYRKKNVNILQITINLDAATTDTSRQSVGRQKSRRSRRLTCRYCCVCKRSDEIVNVVSWAIVSAENDGPRSMRSTRETWISHVKIGRTGRRAKRR